MSEEQILQLWRSGYTKHKVAQIYKRIYNEQVKIVRLELRNRHAGKMISTYEALHKIEKVIWEEIKYFIELMEIHLGLRQVNSYLSYFCAS